MMMAQSLCGTTSLLLVLSSYLKLFFVAFVFSDADLLSLPASGYRGYLKMFQSILQTLLLFAESLLYMCVTTVRKKTNSPGPKLLFQNTNPSFLVRSFPT